MTLRVGEEGVNAQMLRLLKYACRFLNMNHEFKLKCYPIGGFGVFANEERIFHVSGNIKDDEFQLEAIDAFTVHIDNEKLLKQAFQFFENCLRSEHGCSKITGKSGFLEGKREELIRKNLDLLKSLDFQIQYEDGPEIQVEETRSRKEKEFPFAPTKTQPIERTHKYWTVKVMKELN